MKYRKLGWTDLEVSEIGFGAWGIGKAWWGETDDRQSIRAVCRALDLGLTFIDTAYAYGNGHSERLIAKAFSELGRRCSVATKVPLKSSDWPPKAGTLAKEAFPVEWIVEHTEKSLNNLQTDCLDLQQLHIWQEEWLRESEWLETIRKLKKAGKIRFFGVSLMDHAPETGMEIVRSGLVDSVQVIYNIFDQSPGKNLFPLCKEKGVGVLARVPLDEGGLSGKLHPETKFEPVSFQGDYFREGRLKEIYDRSESLKKLLGHGIETLPELALRFCLSHEAVSTVIPGMRRSEHVEQNCAVSDGTALDQKLLETLKNHAWDRNFYL